MSLREDIYHERGESLLARASRRVAVRLGAAALLLSFVGCGVEAPPENQVNTEHVSQSQSKLITNGDFESDTLGALPAGWTVASYLDPGITDLRPSAQTRASLNLASGGSIQTQVVGGTQGSQYDSALGSASTLRFPKFGTRAVVINYPTGTGQNVNSMSQTWTTTLSDIDPLDGKIHVRFAVAPVLQNPGHGYTDQPYYWVGVTNTTKSKILYQDFNASAQAGVPWQISNGVYYTDWQLVDISPGTADLDVNDTITLEIIASGCAAGGHWGRVYVDGVGPTIPGLYVTATGPDKANADSDITYTFSYNNGGTGAATNTSFSFTTPPNTTFTSVSGISGCTLPTVGATGTVTCPIGTLGASSSGSFQATVHIDAAATGTITNGTYSIGADGVSPLIGSKVYTTVTSGVSYADVSASISDGVAAVQWGSATTYNLVVTNNSLVDAPSVAVAAAVPTNVSSVTWTCAGTGGGTCTASGAGAISDTVNLPAGASVTYTLSANIASGTGSSSVLYLATATVGSGVQDSNSSNNTAVDSDAVAILETVTVTNGSPSLGSVSTVPLAINCGSTCSAQFAQGSTVIFSMSPVAGALFKGWTGDCASAGKSSTCSLTVSGPINVGADFVTAGPASLAAGGGDNQSAVVQAAFGQPLSVTVLNGAGDPVSGATVTFTAPSLGASLLIPSSTAQTNASGVASTIVTANSVVGAYQVSAAVSGVSTPVVFSLANTPGPAASVSFDSISLGQSAVVNTSFTNPVTVTVRDVYGNIVSGANVTFSVPSAGATATLSASSGQSDANGQVSVTATAGTTAGAYQITAALDEEVSTAQALFTNLPGSPAKLVVQSGDEQQATVHTAYSSNLTVLVTDQYDNPVPAIPVDFVAPNTGASVSLGSSSVATDSAGNASVSAFAGDVAGAFQVTASIDSPALQTTFSLTNRPGVPASLVVVDQAQSQSTVVGTAFVNPVAVIVRDAYSNLIPGVTVSFAVPGTGASAVLSASSAVTDAQGVAQVTATANTLAGKYDATATIAAQSLSTAAALTNLAGAPATVVVVEGDNGEATVATAFASPLKVLVSDGYSNPVPNTLVTFTNPETGATAVLSATTSSTGSNGEAEITATAGHVTGSYSVTATIDGAEAPAVFHLKNNPGAAATLDADPLSSPQATLVMTNFTNPLRLVVRDAFDNAVPGITVHLSGPSEGPMAFLGGSTSNLATVVSDSSGGISVVAQANDKSGSYIVEASVDGVMTPAFFTLRNTPDVPASLVLLAGGGQTTVVNTAFATPISIQVRDVHGNGVPNTTVNFVVPSVAGVVVPSAVLPSLVLVTDNDGKVSTTATANGKVGSYNVVAIVDGASTPIAVPLTNSVSTAAKIVVDTESTSQSAKVKTAFANPLRVVVTDAAGNPVSGSVVTFSVPTSEPTVTLSSTTATTDATGAASVLATAGSTVGSYQVTASIGDGAISSVFDLANLSGDPASLAVVSGGSSTVVAKAAFPALVIALTDSFGNPVPNVAVSLAVPTSTPSITVQTATLLTDAQGQVSFALTAGDVPGTGEVTLTAPGASTPLSVPVTVTSIATTVTVSVSPQKVYAGEPVTLTAQVQSDSGTPTGVVHFFIDGVEVGSAPVVNGVATLTIKAPSNSPFKVSAQFEGEGAYGSSTSASEVSVSTDTTSLSGGPGCAVSAGTKSGPGALWSLLPFAALLLLRKRSR